VRRRVAARTGETCFRCPPTVLSVDRQVGPGQVRDHPDLRRRQPDPALVIAAPPQRLGGQCGIPFGAKEVVRHCPCELTALSQRSASTAGKGVCGKWHVPFSSFLCDRADLLWAITRTGRTFDANQVSIPLGRPPYGFGEDCNVSDVRIDARSIG
jgi:hypothetical protein